MKKILSIVLCLLLQLSLLAACSSADSSDPYSGLTLYESEAGISLYMAKGFSKNSAEGVACAYSKGSTGLACNVESIEALESFGYSSLSEADYAQLIMDAYGYDAVPQTDEYGLTYVIYEQEVTGIPYTYVAFFIKGETVFWAANFMCPTTDLSKNEADFHLWASSITVSN